MGVNYLVFLLLELEIIGKSTIEYYADVLRFCNILYLSIVLTIDTNMSFTASFEYQVPKVGVRLALLILFHFFNYIKFYAAALSKTKLCICLV